MNQLFTGRGLLNNAVFSGTLDFLSRDDINATIAADPKLSWRDPHPGRLIYCCEKRKIHRLKMFLDTPRVFIAWPERMYWRHGQRYSAKNIYDAARNAYNEDALLLAIPLYEWTPAFAAYALRDHIASTSWTRVADLLLEKGGPETMSRLQRREDAYSCLMRASPEMMQWFVGHGIDPNNAICAMFGNETILEHYIRFPNQEKVKLLLSAGARPTQKMIDLAQEKGEEADYEDPESSYCYEFYDIKKLLEAAMKK